MKITSDIVSLVLLIYFSGIAFLPAQSITKKSNNQFEYQERLYKYGDMGNIFQKHEIANDHFLIANKKNKASKGWGKASLI